MTDERLVTFAAATILLAALKCQDIDLELRDTSFETCWTQCLSILNHYKEQIHSASRAIRVLQTLRSQVMATQHQRKTPLYVSAFAGVWMRLEWKLDHKLTDFGLQTRSPETTLSRSRRCISIRRCRWISATSTPTEPTVSPTHGLASRFSTWTGWTLSRFHE
jgi:hypothetical protein